MEAGTGIISGGLGKDDRGGRDDHSQLGKGEDRTNQAKIREIRENFG